MEKTLTFTSVLAAASSGLASLVARDSVTANVFFNNNTGTPQHLASGILYGVPDKVDQVQDHWYTDMGFNYLRAGGAQLPAPARGWIWGLTEYENRFQSALSNYRTAREHGAKFIFLIHDLWGADGTQNSSTPYPGDDDDWTYWDSYFNQLVSDMKANSMIDDVIIDIWNEPDLGTAFWGRSQAQYLLYWGRAYYQFRAAFGTDVLLSGPATSSEPQTYNSWWTEYMSYVAENNSVPDQWAWHMESGGGNLVEANNGLNALLAAYDLPTKPININEYAVFGEQVPAGSAWWISQLERINAIGLRGNWLSGYQLHDFLASLLSKPNAQNSAYNYEGNNYFANGDYQIYKYYNLNMTGYRVATTPSSDSYLDSYAVVGRDKAQVMVGVRQKTGTWTLQLNDLSALGLPESGTLQVQTYGFVTAPLNPHYGEIDGFADLGVYGHGYSGNSVSFPIYQTDTSSAFVFEFAIPANNSATTTTTTMIATTTTSRTATTTTSRTATTTTSRTATTTTSRTATTTTSGAATTTTSGAATITTTLTKSTSSSGTTTSILTSSGDHKQSWANWDSSPPSSSITPTWVPQSGKPGSTVLITLTQTYVVPCSTGVTTLTTTVVTTHCGCTETPIPTIPMAVTTITPAAGWSVSTVYIATVPVAGQTTNTPVAATPAVSAWNTWSTTIQVSGSKNQLAASSSPSTGSQNPVSVYAGSAPRAVPAWISTLFGGVLAVFML